MLLAFDTATRLISLALHDGRELAYEATWHTADNHTIELTPAIQHALRQTGLTPGNLRAVAVAQGPGSYTGLRIGMGVAKGLAAALDLALIAVPTLDILVAGVPPLDGTLVAVIQAGRTRICAQPFTWEGTAWQAASAPAIMSWQQLAATITTPATVAGEIDDVGRAALASSDGPVAIAPGAVNLRRAGFLAEIAWRRLTAGDVDNAATVTPLYLHQPGVPHP